MFSENEQLRFTRLVTEKKLRRPADGKYRVKIVLADGTTVPAPGHVTFGDASYSKETGTFLVRAELPNKDGALRPGQFVRVLLEGAVWIGAARTAETARPMVGMRATGPRNEAREPPFTAAAGMRTASRP